jgi:hypothetical protein
MRTTLGCGGYSSWDQRRQICGVVGWPIYDLDFFCFQYSNSVKQFHRFLRDIDFRLHIVISLVQIMSLYTTESAYRTRLTKLSLRWGVGWAPFRKRFI